MDLIRQNKFIGWVIGILVFLNLLTLTIIWIQSGKPEPPRLDQKGNSPGAPVRLMQREIGLNDEQAKQYGEFRKEHQQEIKVLNDKMDDIKLRIADEIFSPSPNDRIADSLTSEIGTLQSKIEMLRYDHFKSLAQICTPEQKEKLYPVLQEVFRKKGQDQKPDQMLRKEKEERGTPAVKSEKQKPPRNNERPEPPSKEEKLKRYSKRLSLTEEQVKKVSQILIETRNKDEDLKSRMKPDTPGFEEERKRINKTEDESILKILNDDQKKEFEKLIQNRGKR